MMRGLLCGLAAATLWAAPVTAATEIPSKPGKAWKHKATGSAFPPKLAGLDRRSVSYFTAPDVDVAAAYWSADGNDTVTVYFYRNVAGNVPVWFDRSRFFITNLPDKYGKATGNGARAFTPRGQSTASGLMESFSIGGTGKSSALMILPFNGFYAKIRATSKTRDITSLEALMMEAANSFDWSSRTPVISAVPVADCPKPLAARGAAKLIEANAEDKMMAGLLGGLFAQVSAKAVDKKAQVEPPAVFCREPVAASLSYGIYRPNQDTERFILAVHDGGRAVTVGRNGLSELINSEMAQNSGKPAGPARYTVSFVQLDKIETYRDFETLPLAEQAVEQVEKTRPSSVAGTWGKDDKKLTIVTD